MSTEATRADETTCADCGVHATLPVTPGTPLAEIDPRVHADTCPRRTA